MLLEGPPGVGKTLTAESGKLGFLPGVTRLLLCFRLVAEHMKAPLYSINAGQISDDMTGMEERLYEIF